MARIISEDTKALVRAEYDKGGISFKDLCIKFSIGFGSVGRIIDAKNREVRVNTPGVKPRNLSERFWEKVEKTAGCWLWTGRLNKDGYGQFDLDQEHGSVGAHRVSWEFTNGPIPDGFEICHTCDNPPCVRPSHLFKGTHHQNMSDCAAKGRHASQRTGMDHHCSRATMELGEQIMALRQAGKRQRVIAMETGLSQSTVSRIIRGGK